MQGLDAVTTRSVRLYSPRLHVQTQLPRPDVSEPVERTLCVVLATIMFRHPTDCHTLAESSSRFHAINELMASQFPLIILYQESAGFTRGQCMLTYDNPIISNL